MVRRSLPELWGGEVGLATHQMSTNCGQNKGNGLTDTLNHTDAVLEQFYKRNITESITPQASIGKGATAQTIVLTTEQPTN